MTTVLVTGATGFVGSHVAARLAADDHKVRVLVRDAARIERAPALRDASLDVVVGDVVDATSVGEALAGCDSVVHCAAFVSLAERDAEQVEAVNVGGTQLVVGGAVERGVPAVHVSSSSVFALRGTTIDVDSPLGEGGGCYSRSKVAAERFVRARQDEGAPVAIVYPSGVLGPSDPAGTSTMQGLIGWIVTPPRMSSGAAIVDVRDVAEVAARALDRPGRWMAGGRFLPYDELNAAIAGVTGVRRREIPMPGPVLRTAGRAGDVVKRFVPFAFPLTLEAMTMATSACSYDSTATVEQLGIEWRALDETLEAAIRDLVATGRLRPKYAGRLA
jgi:nucleoside-diphosphate-sugar epimerase